MTSWHCSFENWVLIHPGVCKTSIHGRICVLPDVTGHQFPQKPQPAGSWVRHSRHIPTIARDQRLGTNILIPLGDGFDMTMEKS